MIKTNGECRINGLHIAEVSIKVQYGAKPAMEAVYATLEKGEETLSTHGRCNAYPNNWSTDTLTILDELLEFMERDLIPRHFKVLSGQEEKNASQGLESGGLEEVDQV